MSLIMSSKDENYEGNTVIDQRIEGGLVFFTRVLDSGAHVTTWRPASEAVKTASIARTIQQIPPQQ